MALAVRIAGAMPNARPVALLLLGSLAAALPAQRPSPAELQQRRQDKLAKPVFAGWSTDWAKAATAARAGHKPILAYFTRSYQPCLPCNQLEDSVLATPEFTRFAAGAVLFVHCSSHTADEPLPDLPKQHGLTAFPTVCWFDADGQLLLRQDDKTVAGFVAALPKVVELQALQARAGDDPGAATKLFLLQLELGTLTLQQMQERSAQLSGLSDEQRAFVEQKITDATLLELERDRQLAPKELGQRLAGLARAGRRPSSGSAVSQWFWNQLLDHARQQRDAELAQLAYDQLVAQFGKDQRYQRALAAWRQQLVEASGGK